MFDNFPLWPARAATTAGQVDALYIFLVLLSAFMSVAIFIMILVFATKYRRRHGRQADENQKYPTRSLAKAHPHFPLPGYVQIR